MITLFFNVSVAPALFPIITVQFLFLPVHMGSLSPRPHYDASFLFVFFQNLMKPRLTQNFCSLPPSPLVYCIIRVHRHLSQWQSLTSRCGVCHTVCFMRLSPYVLEVLYALSHIMGPFVCISCLSRVYSNLCPLSSQTACFLAIEFLTGFEFNPQSHTHGLQTHPPISTVKKRNLKKIKIKK